MSGLTLKKVVIVVALVAISVLIAQISVELTTIQRYCGQEGCMALGGFPLSMYENSGTGSSERIEIAYNLNLAIHFVFWFVILARIIIKHQRRQKTRKLQRESLEE